MSSSGEVSLVEFKMGDTSQELPVPATPTPTPSLKQQPQMIVLRPKPDPLLKVLKQGTSLLEHNVMF